MSSSESNCFPRETPEMAIPDKSKLRYEKAYETYRNWCAAKGDKISDSETVLLSYFGDLARVKKASTLWATYSMLRTTLNLRHSVDISNYARLGAFLKKQNVGYKAKKSSVLTEEDIDRFLNNAPIEYLPQKVALIIGISGACRCDELIKMKIGDIDFLENKIVIVIPVTKTHRPRSFLITKPEWMKIVNQYNDLRKGIDNERFFLQIRFGHIIKQPFGHNAIGNFPKKIATYLKLNNIDTFSGHCFKRTAAALLANTGNLQRLGGWKPNTTENSSDEQLLIASNADAQSSWWEEEEEKKSFPFDVKQEPEDTETYITATPLPPVSSPVASRSPTPQESSEKIDGSSEKRLIEMLISAENRFVERLKILEERELRVEEREERVADSMCRFFDAFTNYLQTGNSNSSQFILPNNHTTPNDNS